MELSKQEYQAVRVFHRAYQHIAASRDMAEEADAGFDGGEWSGPHHAQAAIQEYLDCLSRVAGRLGMTAEALQNLCNASEHQEAYIWMEANMDHSASYGDTGRSIKRLKPVFEHGGWRNYWVCLYKGQELGTLGSGYRFPRRLEAMDGALRAEEHFRQTGKFPNMCERY